MDAACGTRHPVLAPPVVVEATAADPPGVVHASVARDDAPDRSAGGGAARTVEAASTAAVAEAIERLVATHATLRVRRASSVPGHRRVRLGDCTLHSMAQRCDPRFPHGSAYPDDEWLCEMFDLRTNEARWAPAALVSLVDHYGALATSSGLAAAETITGALLRATQELVERDAYVTTWLHQLGGRRVEDPGREASLAGLAGLGGEVRAYDITPAFSPHPVALVTGSAALLGAARHSLGVACRATWADAVEKAYLECCQGLVFVGHVLPARPDLRTLRPEDVTGFDEHAVYYSAEPGRWADLPLHRFAVAAPAPADAPAAGRGDAAELRELLDALHRAGVQVLYRELATPESVQLGVRVARVVTPELTPLHHDHRWPFLGGRADDARWRYPDAPERTGGRTFPSPHPHALG